MEHVLVCIVPKLRRWSFPGGLGDQGQGQRTPPSDEWALLLWCGSSSRKLMELWYEILSILEDVNLVDEAAQIIWSLCSNGKFAVQSLYAVINLRGVKLVHAQAVWKLKMPPRVQIFLWWL